MPIIALSSDEVEVACDALWFLKRSGRLSQAASALWERLQPLRTGDYGQQRPTVALSTTKQDVVKNALDLVDTNIGLDPDERALSDRLSQQT